MSSTQTKVLPTHQPFQVLTLTSTRRTQEHRTGGSGDNNGAKVFVVVYPSNASATYRFTSDHPPSKTQTANADLGYGYGISLDPKSRHRARFWSTAASEQNSQPTLFTLEHSGREGLTIESGPGCGTDDILLRVQVAESVEATAPQFEQCLSAILNDPSTFGVNAATANTTCGASTTWVKSGLSALVSANFIAPLDLGAFEQFLRTKLESQHFKPGTLLQDTAPTAVSFLDEARQATPTSGANGRPKKSRMNSSGIFEKMRRRSTAEVAGVVRLQ